MSSQDPDKNNEFGNQSPAGFPGYNQSVPGYNVQMNQPNNMQMNQGYNNNMNQPNNMQMNQGYNNNMNQANMQMNQGYNNNMNQGYNNNMNQGYNNNMGQPNNMNQANMQMNQGYNNNMNQGYNNNMNQMNPNQGNPGPFNISPNYFAPGFNPRIQFNQDHPAYMMLQQSYEAYVVQKVEFIEALTGCETSNKYKVYVRTDGHKKKQKIFKCKEKSNWCNRNCLDSDCRPFDMKVKFDLKDDDEKNSNWDEHVAQLKRPFECTCYCLNRPKMDITWFNPDPKEIGTVKYPFECCDIRMDVTNNIGKITYTIQASCCQCGFIFRNGVCAACSEVQMPIYKYDNDNKVPENKDGLIRKYVKGALKELFTDADAFKITFPKNADPFDKFNLICATLMIDYAYFEDNSTDQNGGMGGGFDMDFS